MTGTLSGPTGLRRTIAAFKLLAGFALIIVGAVLAIPGIPGPGIPIIVIGLFLLSDRFFWAQKALVWVKRRTGGSGQ